MTKVPPWRPDASAVEVAVTALAVSVSIRAGFDVILSVDDDAVCGQARGMAAVVLPEVKESDALADRRRRRSRWRRRCASRWRGQSV